MARLDSTSSTTNAKPLQIERKSIFEKLTFQIKLLMWKRWKESTKSKLDLIKVLLPAMLFFSLLLLIYAVLDGLFFPDGAEPFIVPFAFWIFMQRLVVHIMHEKSSRLQESMRMMGLSDFAYWTSYVLTDGVILGFVLSFTCALFSTGGLFADANFGVLLGLFFSFTLSAVPFCFFITAFFDTPQTSGQALLAILLGFYVVYIVVFLVGTYDISYQSAQVICCLFPPLALQIGTGAFLKSYDGISVSQISGIMIADIFLYSLLAWYFAQVWPSKIGVSKPFYFPLMPSYWLPNAFPAVGEMSANPLQSNLLQDESKDAEGAAPAAYSSPVPEEVVDEAVLGQPSVVVKKLCKTFAGSLAVNNLSFKMYPNQIFALLGHNGAGKSTTINMLVGMMSPDMTGDSESGAYIYGQSIATEMESIRRSMGVCPQHDVLFENLTVREHILFFAQLKGATYEAAEAEAVELTTLFHLDQRLDHTGAELSGGQKRKLSVAIAVCGGSQFVLLDEPSAGMDPLARRELWDLLQQLRVGRTLLLVSHYMEECEVLGDRVGIMSLGKMQCVGSTAFLKRRFGAGYKLIFDLDKSINGSGNSLEKTAMSTQLLSFVQQFVQDAQIVVDVVMASSEEPQIVINLPFHAVDGFGVFFTKLEDELQARKNPVLNAVTSFGVTITSLEDVFLKVGEDHTVRPNDNKLALGIGNTRQYNFSLTSQVIGLVWRKLTYSFNDFITLPLLLLPIITGVAAAILYEKQVISNQNAINDLVVAGMYIGAYLGAPGLIAEFLVRERADKLRNVLTVMGCDFRAYWLGTFIADYLLMLIPTISFYIMWPAASMPDFYSSKGGLCFFLLLLFNAHLIAFSYFFSFIFASPKSSISLMPIIILLLVISPLVVILILIEIVITVGTTISQSVIAGVMLWGIMLTTPHGALFTALLDTTQDYSQFISQFPPVGATIAFMLFETGVYLFYSYYSDANTVSMLTRQAREDGLNEEAVTQGLDEDVKDERLRAITAGQACYEDSIASLTFDEANPMRVDTDIEEHKAGRSGAADRIPLVIDRLRKVFPPKRSGQMPVTAVEDVAFGVEQGEIFGLLGANGAGKTTTLSMLTRHFLPTAGDAFIAKHSILSDFSRGAIHMGVVTQTNSLWDRLSVEAHLFLFARLRGVPEDLVTQIVDGTIDQLELTPHRKKLAMRLSGGMKRKLCVAIALIGDPAVVLLDEPSAGLDPVSRRNLWGVILRSMAGRSVVLTSHSMDEVEALCRRIGIMVRGQLRCLGTKQRLKSRYGSGFELVIKLRLAGLGSNKDKFAVRAAVDRLTVFIKSLFPSAELLATNGGLCTFQVPREEMKMGVAFGQLTLAKKGPMSVKTAGNGETVEMDLLVEDFTVAQPTLEQVFIRTVNRFTPKSAAAAADGDLIAGSAMTLGGSARMSVEGTSLLGREGGDDDPEAGATRPSLLIGLHEVVEERNKCGCTNRCVKIMAGIAGVLAIAFIGAGLGLGATGQYQASSFFWLIGIIAMITSCTGCNILCCACCQYPKDVE